LGAPRDGFLTLDAMTLGISALSALELESVITYTSSTYFFFNITIHPKNTQRYVVKPIAANTP
jgi:hypothetical protein